MKSLLFPSQLFFASVLLLFLTVFCGSSTLNTSTNQNKTLQELIDAAPPGSIIHIPKGFYTEHLIINKSIILVGESSTNTVLSGGGTGELIKILADNVSIYNLTLCDAELAIALYKTRNCEIAGCVIKNIVMYFGTGIYAFNCINITIKNNQFESIYADNIIFRQVENSVIKGNTFIANKRYSQAVLLYNSSQNIVELNQILGQGVINEGGIGLLYSNNNVIQYNNIIENDWAGISLRYSNGCIIKGNTVAGHKWYGLKLCKCKNNSVYWNNFISNNKHTYIDDCENITWSLENFGNYWDNYLDEDSDMNGVGDNPYKIDSENYDGSPLMGRFYYYKAMDDEWKNLFIVSNSTIETLTVSKTREPASITFNASGRIGTIGFCLVRVPKSFMEPPCDVEVNSYAPTLLLDHSNDEYVILYFTYLHQNQQEKIRVIPEFNNLLVFALFCTLMWIIAFRRKALPLYR